MYYVMLPVWRNNVYIFDMTLKDEEKIAVNYTVVMNNTALIFYKSELKQVYCIVLELMHIR